MDFMTVVTPDGTSFRRELAATSLRIGRSSGNDLVLQDLNVSRTHAEVVRRSEGYYVLDSGGKNGTFVNDRRIDDPVLLRPGDRVRVGSTTLVFNGAPASPVEFSSRPLSTGSDTKFLPADEIRTPALANLQLMLEVTPTPAPYLTAAARSAAAQRDAPASNPALGIILEANEQLVFHRPLAEMFDTIMGLARRAVPFERGLLMLLEGDRLVPQVILVPPDEAGRMISISRTIADRVMLRKESVLASDAQFDERFRQGESVEAQHLRSVMCVPLWNNREVIGLIYVDNRHRAGLFTEENLRILTQLANVAAVKIENARLFEQVIAAERMEQELQKAAEIQDHLLPAEGPPIPGYLVYGSSVPCREVGGDYYDYIALPGSRCVIGLGDVAGKGLPAALLMCSFQASLRALAELDLSPEETLARLNRLLCRQIPINRFVTFFYGVLDIERHSMSYVNAGQNPPYVIRADGRAERLPQPGRPLGLFQDTPYRAESITLGPGEILVCYSDGVTEGQNPSGEEFGEERLLAIAGAAREGAPGDIVRRITVEIDRHHAGSPRQDDVTLVVLKRTA
jgi:phosphoserine phosphatase RsbU/P